MGEEFVGLLPEKLPKDQMGIIEEKVEELDLSNDLMLGESVGSLSPAKDDNEQEKEGLTKAIYELINFNKERKDSVNATQEGDVDGLQSILDACTLCEKQNTDECDQEIYKKQNALNQFGLVP